MPTYDYECAACGRRFEVVHGVHAESPTTCPLCGKGPVRKVITAANVHYKGSGWAKKERRSTVDRRGEERLERQRGFGRRIDVGRGRVVRRRWSGSSAKKSESGSSEAAAKSASKSNEKADKPSKSGASTASD